LALGNLFFYVHNLLNLLLAISFNNCPLFPCFYAQQQYRQVLLRARISYGNSVCLSVRLSVRLSVCLSRPGTDSRPGEIETPGLHRMIA